MFDVTRRVAGGFMPDRYLYSPDPGTPIPSRPGALFVLAEYQVDFFLRFGHRVLKVPGVAILGFLVDRVSQAAKVIHDGFPPVTGKTQSHYWALAKTFTDRMETRQAGFNGLILDQQWSDEVEEILALFGKSMTVPLSEKEKRKLKAHLVDQKLRHVCFCFQLEGKAEKTITSPPVPLSWFESSRVS
jgi:hypothetical protein